MKNNKVFLILNILIPIVVGTIIYYLISPEVIFVKEIDAFMGAGFHITCMWENPLVRFVRNYMLDMLWGYALVFALYFVLGNNTAELWKIFIIAIAFSATMEALQLTPIISGTFDVFDIMAEFFSETVAVFIMKYYFSGGGTKEI